MKEIQVAVVCVLRSNFKNSLHLRDSLEYMPLALSGGYIHMSNSREFDCSRVRQFEALKKKLYEKSSLTP